MHETAGIWSDMGCVREVTERDFEQIIETAGGLDNINQPEAVDLAILQMAINQNGEQPIREMLEREGWTRVAIDELFRRLNAASEPDLSRAINYYGMDTVQELQYLFTEVPSYLDDMISMLNEAADAKIVGMEKVFYNMYQGGYKSTSAQQTISYVMSHVDEIKEVEAYDIRLRNDESFYGLEGPDIVNKDGSIVELKSFNFSRDFYLTHAEDVVESVVEQAGRRLKESPSVTIVFAGNRGNMPVTFRDALNKAIGDKPISFKIE